MYQYLLMNKKQNILIAGPILPPAGGISIHIYRLEQLLKDEFDFTFIDESPSFKKNIFNIRSLNFIRYIKLVMASDLFFIHSGNKYFKKLHILTGKLCRRKVIITLHGYGNERAPLFRKIDSFYFNLSDKIILVNNQIASKLNLKPGKFEVKHAFLPPVMHKESPLPEFITANIKMAKKENKTIICGNASRLKTFNNQDLYGLDMSIEMSKKLNENNQSHLFIYVVTSLDEGKDKYEAAEKFIIENKMQDYFMLLNQEISFVNLIEASDIVLRPTNTDGDALTIREGLFLGKTVIASDVVTRPEGTILFKTRDHHDLLEKLTSAIQDNIMNRKSQESNLLSEDKQYYSNLFNKVMNSN